ncbi:Uncharacterized protein FWK35_00035054 [Aphis craccivora]|uniref:MULE domain-containing protein n=1 Tax=Aphis craccivora TaxID=307492 RepID=A0A6G0VNC3_APHCR|nr:Uncharacterized protein FWK35_00035054 [Aphis craccivora]
MLISYFYLYILGCVHILQIYFGTYIQRRYLSAIIYLFYHPNDICTVLYVFGCRFHLGQAWYRKIQNLGYAPQFNSANDDVGKWLVHIFGLPFLNPEEVAECFTDYCMADKPEIAAIDNRIL